MDVLNMKELMAALAERGHNVSRQTVTLRLSPLLEQAGLARHLPGGRLGVWVYAPEAVEMLALYLDRQRQVLQGSPASKHSFAAFQEYTGERG